ncbi:MAG: choice-of-anchor Q domain-containing protein [Chloroflexota bacterium]
MICWRWSATLTNSIVTGNHWYACQRFASGTVGHVVSSHNLIQDDSCNPTASDIITGSAGLGVLADNGGPTLTHSLRAASRAIDAADDSVCSAIDQRGVARPNGAHCDSGSYGYP